ncbi:hypothetical protein EJ04DRAFT_511210 [Polyplosphaeria fusca]|uniref:Uncharacterized protein n=1 Tax=Polyplosphaeria fusca TaxID=682080 RepID=A0A9P4V333_9PLEO|nr:hypothetical protein EJ04DRAFT_511210 [Polyplosphaeria fusca]
MVRHGKLLMSMSLASCSVKSRLDVRCTPADQVDTAIWVLARPGKRAAASPQRSNSLDAASQQMALGGRAVVLMARGGPWGQLINHGNKFSPATALETCRTSSAPKIIALRSRAIDMGRAAWHDRDASKAQ